MIGVFVCVAIFFYFYLVRLHTTEVIMKVKPILRKYLGYEKVR